MDATKQKAISTAAAGMSDVDFNAELSNLKLAQLLSGPLLAAIKGMTIAAANTIEFVRKVAFTRAPNGGLGEPIMLKFKLSKPGGILGTSANTSTVTVPFLTMIHLPYLRLDNVTVEFNVKLTSTRTQDLSASTDKSKTTSKTSSSTSSAEQGSWQSSNTTTSTKKGGDNGNPFYWDTSTSSSDTPISTDKSDWTRESSLMGIAQSKIEAKSGNTISKDYSLQVVIEATQAALPPGIEKILDILEEEMRDTTQDQAVTQMMQTFMK